MIQAQWPTIIMASAWMTIVAIVFGYGSLSGYLESDWMTIFVWLIMPILLMSIILSSGGRHASDDN